ncbi:hypothetical protein BKA81DRAFT_405307 [Phyllosticta paracitricarpa]|uniref:Uncharacterized protein n=1 Tax=Phyllosticta paracitricarpa TaxID=2016321 RepID=A0ABR1NKA8_9PEZI
MDFSAFSHGPARSGPANKMRRYMARSDEEVDENIEDDSHRVGWPQFRPLPRTFVKIDDLASFVSDSHRIFDVLGSVLTSQSVEFSGMEFGHMGTRGGSEPPLPTLLVAARNKSSGRTSWHLAVLRLVRKIQALVISNDDFGVEIVEELFPLYRPIEAGDPMIPIWENQIAPKVMEILEGKSLFWQCLSLVRLGGSHTPEPTRTISIESPVADAKNWKPVIFKIKNDIRRFYSSDINVMISQAQKMDSAGYVQFNRNLWPRMWSGPMCVGDGLAPVETLDSTGTLGGFLKIELKGKTTPLMLTNFHVIKVPKLESVLRPKNQKLPLKSTRFSEVPSPYIINVPAQMDSKESLRVLDGSIQNCDEIINSDANGPSLKMKAEFGDRTAQGNLEDFGKELAKYEEEKSKIKATMTRAAGSLMTTSGYQHLSKSGRCFTLDWAVLNIDPSRNFRPDTVPRDKSSVQIADGMDLPSWTQGVMNDQKFAGVRSKDGIDTVVKLGRMSGWTRGKRNFAPASWKDLRQEDPEVGGWHQDSCGVVTSCIRIEPYSESDGTKFLNPSKFAQSGDSGSVVRDEETGTWLGLLFGAHPQDGWALMTPIDIILESIEDVTGGRVVDPVPLE